MVSEYEVRYDKVRKKYYAIRKDREGFEWAIVESISHSRTTTDKWARDVGAGAFSGIFRPYQVGRCHKRQHDEIIDTYTVYRLGEPENIIVRCHTKREAVLTAAEWSGLPLSFWYAARGDEYAAVV